MTLDEILVASLSKEKTINSFVMAWQLPHPFRNLNGKLTFIGSRLPDSAVAATDYVCRVRADGLQMQRTLDRELPERPQDRPQIIYIDADHGIDALVTQINGLVKLCAPNAVFVFPGAVPPRRSVATRQPSESWWTGDVWTLAEILKDHGAAVYTLPVRPTGVLVAVGVQAIDPKRASASAQKQQEEVLDDAMLAARFAHSEPDLILEAIAAAFENSSAERFVQIEYNENETNALNTTVVDKEKMSEDKAPIFAIDLSGKGLDLSRLEQVNRMTHGVRISEFGPATILGRDVILVEDGNVSSYYGKNYSKGAVASALSRLAGERATGSDLPTMIDVHNGKFRISRDIVDAAIDLDFPVFTVTPDEPMNYGMWLLYSVPSIAHFNRMRADYPKMMAMMHRPWQRKMLVDLGLKPNDLIDQTLGLCYNVPAVATMRQTHRTLRFSASDIEAFDEVGERSLSQGEMGYERLFISRLSHTKKGAYRGLVNEEELIDALKPLGFRAVEPEYFGVLQQARLFRDAKVIVGLGGAAMFNVAFCKPSTLVIDIESSTNFVFAHSGLFGSRGVDYGIILGESDETDDHPVHKRWRIDVPKVVDAIRSAL